MELRGIDFGPVWTASGTLGFYGEGYPYQHALHRSFGWCDFTGITLVAKTVTIDPRMGKEYGQPGNMRLNKNGSVPWWPLKPDCIYVDMVRGIALNAVGLSNLGAEEHFRDGRWQYWKKPLVISYMAVGKTKEERDTERRKFVGKALLEYFPHFHFLTRVAIQENYSCPNTGHQVAFDELEDEVHEGLEIGSLLGVPQIPKFNVLLPVSTAKKISDDKNCDGLCVSNTIPFGSLPEKIDWQRLFGGKSPLAHLGGGGLSGKPLLLLVADWIVRARQAGVEKPINAGGGILHPDDVNTLAYAGADSVFIGSASFLRPWRIRAIIDHAYEVYGYEPVERGK